MRIITYQKIRMSYWKSYERKLIYKIFMLHKMTKGSSVYCGNN